MTAPLYEIGQIGQGISLVFAVLIGTAFGFFLEKGGLGDARKLAAQFYLTDMTVFKVMFTAIITAALGLFICSWTGFLDLTLIEYRPTYVIPYIVAGLLFGAGFVMSGLCPGTAVVSCATGKIDGLVVLFGVFFGIFLFGETIDLLGDLIYATPMNQISIPAFFNASYGLVVCLMVIIALAGFVAAGKIEQKYTTKLDNQAAEHSSKSKFNLVAFAVAMALALIVMLAGNPYKTSKMDEGDGLEISESGAELISVEKVAEMIMSKNEVSAIFDLRSADKYDQYHIPTAILFSDSLLPGNLGSNSKEIIVYTQGSRVDEAVLSSLNMKFHGGFCIVDGGLNKWFDEILFPNLNIPKGFSREQAERISKRSMYFGGTPKMRKTDNGKTEKYLREGC